MPQFVGTHIMNHLATEEYKHQLTLFRIWNGGMINQLMSIEIAAGVCSYFARIGMIYESCRLTTTAKYTRNSEPISIKSILDIPESLCFINSEEQHYHPAIKTPKPYEYFIGPQDNNFSEGRKQLILNNSSDYHFDNNLANYSIMFADRPKTVDLALSKVTFKSEYVEFSNYVAKQLGNFNGIHLRFTDFSKQILLLKKNDIDAAINKISNLPVIIATDDQKCDIAKNHIEKYGCIDSFVINEFKKDFDSLTIHNEIILGLISMLVLTHSQRFVGTPKSTYSNYIHRRINQRNHGVHDWLSIGTSKPIFEGKYSWNSFPEMTIEQKLWQMEWPESLLRL